MRYFEPSEYRCRCGNVGCSAPLELSAPLAERLDALREAYGEPIRLNSGLRCPTQNSLAGGVKESEHLTGEAADIFCASGDRRRALLKLIIPMFDRVGIAKTFIHVGVSTKLPQAVWLY